MSGFRNPIVAGLDLIRAAIRSPNYVPGVSGWSINRDGTAEFQDLTARGDIDADSITVPSGTGTGQGRMVIESNIPPELTDAVIGIVSALLFYVIDEASGLERGYFFIANSNENAEFTNPSLQFGEVQYPILGDPGSATVANVKANKISIMMDNLIPLDRFFNIHISDIGGLTFQDGSFLGSIDGTFGTNNVNIALPTQDGTGGVFQMAEDALFEIPTLARALMNLNGTDRLNIAGACLRVQNGGIIVVETGGEINVDTGASITLDAGSTLQADTDTTVDLGRLNCRLFRSAALGALTTATLTLIPWDGESWDPLAMHDPASNPSRINFARDCKASINVVINFDSNVNGSRICMVRKNSAGNAAGGTELVEVTFEAPETAGHRGYAGVEVSHQFVAGDYIEVFAYQNSGGNLAITSGTTRSYVEVTELTV